MKYKNLDVYWDELTGSVLLFGEESDAISFLKEFSAKRSPYCSYPISDNKKIGVKRALKMLFDTYGDQHFFTDGKEVIFDYNKMKLSGIKPFDRDEFLKIFVVQCQKEDSLYLYQNAVEKNNKNMLFVKDEDDEYPQFYLWVKWVRNTDDINTLDLLVTLKYWSDDHSVMENCFEYRGEDEVFDLLTKVDEVYYDDRFY
mgnify:CR=1 FL=1